VGSWVWICPKLGYFQWIEHQAVVLGPMKELKCSSFIKLALDLLLEEFTGGAHELVTFLLLIYCKIIIHILQKLPLVWHIPPHKLIN